MFRIGFFVMRFLLVYVDIRPIAILLLIMLKRLLLIAHQFPLEVCLVCKEGYFLTEKALCEEVADKPKSFQCGEHCSTCDVEGGCDDCTTPSAGTSFAAKFQTPE